MTEWEALDMMRDIYCRILRVAEAYQITINIEPHGYFTTKPEVMAEMPASAPAFRTRTPVTVENVKTVERGEEAIRALGFRQFRVRFHGELVRIEIAKDELARAADLGTFAALTAIFKPLGFKYITLDLEGYRRGSMNEVLDLHTRP